MATLRKQVEANVQDVSSKDLKLVEAQETIKQVHTLKVLFF